MKQPGKQQTDRHSSRNVLVHCLIRYLFTYVGDGDRLNGGKQQKPQENQLAKVVDRQVNPMAMLSTHPEQR